MREPFLTAVDAEDDKKKNRNRNRNRNRNSKRAHLLFSRKAAKYAKETYLNLESYA
jgi:hypothetical protein